MLDRPACHERSIVFTRIGLQLRCWQREGIHLHLTMSFAEIKQQIPTLAPEERLELAALIAHLSRTDDPQYQADLDRKLADMDAGKKFTQADLERVHADLIAKGQ